MLTRPSEPTQSGASLSDWGGAAVTQLPVEWNQTGLSSCLSRHIRLPSRRRAVAPCWPRPRTHRGPRGSRKCQERSSHALASPDRFARTPLGELTGPPAVFKNKPAALKVKCVDPIRGAFTAGFQHQRDLRRVVTPPRSVLTKLPFTR